MEIISEFLNGAKLLKPSVFKDARGCFFESYNKKVFCELGIKNNFVQDNQSYSLRGVFRGLHFQRPPFAQAKLLRVLEGEIEDFIVDLRAGSPSFGHCKKIILNAGNNHILFVPRGFAHGFYVLGECAKLFYKCDNFYNPSSESGINFKSVSLNISLPKDFAPITSEKDLLLPSLEEYLKNPLFNYENI